MTDRGRDLLRRALELSPVERAELADDLYSSLDDPAAIDASWREELQRRLADVKREGSSYPSWDESLARAQKHLDERRSRGG